MTPDVKMSLTKLPVELFDIIASNILCYKSLYALARTSRMCATVTLPHLYHKVDFDTVPPNFLNYLLLPDRSDAWQTWVREITITLKNGNKKSMLSDWTLLTELLTKLPANRLRKLQYLFLPPRFCRPPS